MKLKDVSKYIQYGDPEANVYILSEKECLELRHKAIALAMIKQDIKRMYEILKGYNKI